MDKIMEKVMEEKAWCTLTIVSKSRHTIYVVTSHLVTSWSWRRMSKKRAVDTTTLWRAFVYKLVTVPVRVQKDDPGIRNM